MSSLAQSLNANFGLLPETCEYTECPKFIGMISLRFQEGQLHVPCLIEVKIQQALAQYGNKKSLADYLKANRKGDKIWKK